MQRLFSRNFASLPVIIKILIAGIVYWVFSWIGTLTFYTDIGTAIYWPAAGIAILAVYLLGRNALTGIFISAFIINYTVYREGYHSFPALIASITAIATANTLAALLGSNCLKIRILKNGRSFFSLGSAVAFMFFVVFIPSLMTSLVGGSVTYYSGIAPDFFTKAHNWLLADFIGILVIVPTGMAWLEKPEIKINRSKIPEFIVIICLLIFSGYTIFTDFFGNYIYNFLIAYFTTPLYLWLALRFESKAITTVQILALVCISYLSIYASNDYLGSLVEKPFVLLQGFSILISTLILIVHSIFIERQMSIDSLHKSEQDLKDVLINLPLGLGILNNDVIPTFLNKEFINKTGLELNVFNEIGTELDSKTATIQQSSLLRNIWKGFIHNLDVDEVHERDIVFKTTTNEVRDFSLNISHLKDKYLMVMMDVTQRKQLLERIKEDERRLNSLIQNLQGMVYQCRLDRNRTMEFVSEGSFQLTGYLPSELIYNSKTPYISVIVERFRKYALDSFEKAIKRGEPYSIQYQIITKGGGLKWVAENGNGIFSNDGVCRSIEGFIFDITDRVESLEYLKKGEEKYHSLFENMPVSLWEDDYSDVKKYIDSLPKNTKEDLYYNLVNKPELYQELVSKVRILDMNRASLEMYGESDKNELVRNVQGIFAMGDYKAFCSVLASFYNGTSTLEERIMDVKIKRKKRILSVRWFIMPGHEKNLSRVLVTLLDITDIQKAEKEIRLLNQSLEKKVLKRTQELGRANLELEAFSYSVSHDLKAPLRAVRGFSSLLMEEYGNQLPDGATHYIRNVQKNTDKMTKLITDLLHFSRLGTKSIFYSGIDSFKLVQGIWEDLFNLQKPDEIEFIIQPLPEVYADETLLSQVFTNLISNALKFSKQGIPGKIEVSCISDAEFHEFCVSDQGIGFEQKFAEKIFQVFQRLHSEEEFEGSGVGLALVQRIVHRHGGIIRALSKPDEGTRIYFTLPVEIDSELAD